MFIDDVIAANLRGLLLKEYPYPPRAKLEAELSWLEHAVVYQIDTVSRWVDGGLARRDPPPYPCIAPLAPHMWFEWTVPDRIPCRTGVLFRSIDFDDEDAEKTKWMFWAYVFNHFSGDHRPHLLPGYGEFGVAPDGELVYGSTSWMPGWEEYDGLNEDEQRDIQATISMQFNYAFVALSLAHCKNVQIVERRQPRQQVRAAEREGRRLVTYKTLVIDPSHASVKHEQGRIDRGESAPKALHICRGHFATYTDDKPLFGKYTGRYFIPMHTRGTLKAGAVVKDYAVVAP